MAVDDPQAGLGLAQTGYVQDSGLGHMLSAPEVEAPELQRDKARKINMFV